MKKRFNRTFIPISDDTIENDDRPELDPSDFLSSSLHLVYDESNSSRRSFGRNGNRIRKGGRGVGRKIKSKKT